jgi:CIC family chloride channel protein
LRPVRMSKAYNSIIDTIIHFTHERFKLSEHWALILVASLVGSITGVAAVLFRWLVVSSYEFFFGTTMDFMGRHIGGFSHYFIPVIPMTGGLIVGLIVHYYASESKGHGVPEVMAAVALKGGVIRPRMALAKATSAAICIGSGGSAGREGPIVAIGSAIASTIGRVFRLSGDRVKILVGCGAGAGISAVFNAPIAGVLFALEIIIGDFAIHTFSPVIISSVISSVVAHSLVGSHAAFQVPEYELITAWEIPMYIIMGVLCGVVAVTFTKTLYKLEDFFEEKVNIHPVLKPAIGGFMVGVIGLFYPHVLSGGYEFMTVALHGHMIWKLMLALLIFKILATSLTLGSGSSGGIFAPSLFIGAMAGGFFGVIVNSLFPGITAPQGAYALVGMGAVVAGTTHAPITAILILFEMSNDYSIILPLMLACVFSTLVAHRLKRESIYTMKLVRRGINIRGGRDVALLDNIKAGEVMKKEYNSVPPEMTLRSLLRVMENGGDDCYPVVDRYGEFRGVVSIQDIRNLITKEGMQDLVIVSDIIGGKPLTLTPDQNLNDAFRLFGMMDKSILPVIDPDKPGRLMGILHRMDVLSTYNRRLLQKEH